MNAFEPESAGLCDRCLKELISGRGEFYEIQIDAKVDSSPPILDSSSPADLDSLDRQWGEVIRQLESTPQVDAENQVRCRRRLLLCGTCFPLWIDDPTGSG
ncbi:hypothetical protein FYK55_00060 [Roseiconus nitratireducens]|uniref:Uncharacterized protein n=1 Tax=Roseiconus nitratireducens TaxID=2605748 RepID=A0A5M6DH42_9BACT|nr:hypothetical protein [Roseiconus nitratireducens]KAA5546864.1 hypothetical protein FYK55_00060 [Roseiconus nitratireducens]